MSNKVNKEVADYLTLLKFETEYQKLLFYKEILKPHKEYGFKVEKVMKESGEHNLI